MCANTRINNYSDIVLYCIFHIEYNDIESIANKNNCMQLYNYMPDAIVAGAASLSFQYGGFVNKTNYARN